MHSSTAGYVRLEDVEPGATNVPVFDVPEATAFRPQAVRGVARYRTELATGRPLDALLVNKGSDVLVASFHGATQRAKYWLPRFEWFRTLTGTEYSSIYYSDPTLHLHERLELAWYTGWAELDLHPLLAEWTRRAAEAVGARHVLLTGSSGGGFACLQVSAFLPRSVAVPFSAQTSLSNYYVNGSRSAQRRYVMTVMPHLAPEDPKKLGEDEDWSTALGSRASAVRRYHSRQANRVLYVQNMNDKAHVDDHYLPFRSAVEAWATPDEIQFVEYQGPERHNPPDRATFRSCLGQAVAWSRSGCR